ncbi:MAG: hemerythrin family protein [Pseudorhodoplanes sp.]|nr:hemerythrin family protein [Pseudorhodoplanes sp.]
MNYLDWNSTFHTGIASIDYDHRRLIEMLNEIHDLIEQSAERCTISDELADFYAFAEGHFALEKKLMQDENLPDLQERRDIHHRLLDQVREIMDGYEDGIYQPAERLPETLKLWLVGAIGIDVKIFAAIGDTSLHH